MNNFTRHFLLLFIMTGVCTSAYGLSKSLLRVENAPKTSMDYSFNERTNNASTGYAPYASASAFHTIDVESEEAYLDRMISRAELERKQDYHKMTHEQYCDKYPLDDEYCVQKPGAFEEVVAIGDRQTTPGQQTTAQHTTTAQQTQQTTQSQYPTTAQTQPTTTTNGRTVGTDTFGRPVIANKTVRNGPCTPPQRSQHFLNKILTSGKYAQSDPAFEKIMITTFRAEGDCGHDKDDSGGYTCYGISQNNNPEVNVRNLTRAGAEDIANRKYYRQHGIEKLPDYVRGDVFTFGWASGPVTGIKHFCRVLKIPERSKIDDEVARAAETYNGDLHNDYLDDMQQYFVQVSKRGNNKKFLKGWMNRVKLTRENGCHEPTTDPLTR